MSLQIHKLKVKTGLEGGSELSLVGTWICVLPTNKHYDSPRGPFTVNFLTLCLLVYRRLQAFMLIRVQVLSSGLAGCREWGQAHSGTLACSSSLAPATQRQLSSGEVQRGHLEPCRFKTESTPESPLCEKGEGLPHSTVGVPVSNGRHSHCRRGCSVHHGLRRTPATTVLEQQQKNVIKTRTPHTISTSSVLLSLCFVCPVNFLPLLLPS